MILSQEQEQQHQKGDETVLLDYVQTLVELERSLTEAMELAEPWLPGGTARPLPTTAAPSSSSVSNDTSTTSPIRNVLNIPAVARSLASRTSALVGWNVDNVDDRRDTRKLR